MRHILIIIIKILFLTCTSKRYLLKTGSNSKEIYDEIAIKDSHNDYMADVKIQSVDVGKSVELKCVSPKEFSGCYFSKTDEKLIYRIEPTSSFQNNRISCLCDVSIQHFNQLAGWIRTRYSSMIRV